MLSLSGLPKDCRIGKNWMPKKELKDSEISLFFCCSIIRGLDKIWIGEYNGIKAGLAAYRVKGDLIINSTIMFFKKKKQEKSGDEIPLNEKIEKAIAKKKRQIIGMWIVAFLGGIGWTHSVYTVGSYWRELNTPRTIVINNAEAKEIEPIVAQKESTWNVAEFSAYTASVDETDANPLVMASGKMVYVGAIACPASMKFGTKIEVRGVGEFTCEDRMNSRYSEHFDIFKMTKDEAFKFGRKTLEWREI